MGIKSPNPKISRNEANTDDKIKIEKNIFFLKSNIFNRLSIKLYIYKVGYQNNFLVTYTRN